LTTHDNSYEQLDKNDLLVQTQEAFVGLLGLFVELGEFINIKADKETKKYKSLWEQEMANKSESLIHEN
jgi:hypothetical protein